MRGDFSRWTFDQKKAYSQVLMQQGRVLLDADWNEQVAIQLQLLRQLSADLIGPHGGPKDNCGFGITPVERDLKLSGGRYYVDGLLCEVAPDTLYSKQPYPFFTDSHPKLPDNGYLVYLDVWEQLVTVAQDENLADVALGGADTCARAHVIWQVKTVETELFSAEVTNALIANCTETNKVLPQLRAQLDDLGAQHADITHGLLKVKANTPEEQTDACLTPPDNRYRGLENQLYRVEIHQGGRADQATFKWSRENGSVVFPVLSSEGKVLQIGGVRDNVHAFKKDDWLELTSVQLEWQQTPAQLRQVTQAQGQRVTLDTVGAASLPNTEKGWLARRWDQQERENAPLKDGAVPMHEANSDTDWIELEDGIRIQFQPGNHVYRPGDYWIFAARTATGDVQWPRDATGQTLEQPPMGIQHHYAPLAFVKPGDSKAKELRLQFAGLATCIE